MDQKPEPNEKEYDPNWAKNLMSELQASLSDVGDSLEKAWNEGKNNPKLKKFGEDMKETFKKMGDDIDDLFNKKTEG